ncbi:MAG: DUF2384 domain-containing protein [Nitrincola sp.]|nr:DUF2384 domain-containing protein [Nitrincola sp.]
MSAQPETRPDPAVVLSKALLNASKQLTLTQSELAKVIGIHRTGISRLKQQLDLQPDTKQGELALLLIRAARALYALAGGDGDWIKHFMRSNNRLTGGIPAEQIQTVQGLVKVVVCLDALRGKV